MIKLGKLAEHAMNKEFPNNWKSLAVMMNIPYSMYGDGEDDLPEDASIEIEFSDTDVLTIKADNSISTTSQLPNEMVGQLIVELAQKVDGNV